ncbi:MAG: ABC transporter permease [Fastidiosipilaceae bacterium]|jgi:peptide/nickel transport system permease protein
MHLISFRRTIKLNTTGCLGLAILLVIVSLAVAAPLFTKYDPHAYTGLIFQRPSSQFWMGTNDVGQDVWSNLLYGGRTSLIVGFGAASLSLLISVLVGCLAAFFGGICDNVLMRLVDVILAIPPIVLILLIAAYLKPSMFILILLLSFFLWPSGTRIVRAQVLLLKSSTHINAARTFGAGLFYLIWRHIIPEMGPILCVLLIQNARKAVFMEAGLSFLGVSDPTIISWGKMMQQALSFSYMDVWKWCLLPAGMALSLNITGFMLISFSLESVLNPRLQGRKDKDYVTGY